jgi:hypothetical protein
MVVMVTLGLAPMIYFPYPCDLVMLGLNKNLRLLVQPITIV